MNVAVLAAFLAGAALAQPSDVGPALQDFEEISAAEIGSVIEGVNSLNELRRGVTPRRRLGKQDGVPVFVRTSDGNVAKLLVDWVLHKKADGWVLVLLRFVTYSGEGREQVVADGRNATLFEGFAFDLDAGQVVPLGIGEDLQLTEHARLAAASSSKLYTVEWMEYPQVERAQPVGPEFGSPLEEPLQGVGVTINEVEVTALRRGIFRWLRCFRWRRGRCR
jgi:hypothetical protein